MAIGIATILPMIDTFGIVFATSVYAVVLWIAAG